ncbi:6-phosphofructokinase [Lapidilactobacillus mulanensis]|uniref:ATP-dependent 6-phosphofructokinase n=1 Tax=Lapidilactobacillus mulanensis TaxID=2485999 RepID=A0ABW4DNP0_9LACO|nr:6-phosphofructokinase [Lapidilactobacillus mulanensis]
MKKIGILTSGGDAPGMNAAIRAVALRAFDEGLEVFGINYGFAGLVAGDVFPLTREILADKIARGGTFLYSARYPEFAKVEGQLKGIDQLKKFGIDALVVIGGDGSYHGALRMTEHGYNTVGLPGTIDNDIPYTDFTIGFDTALTTAVDAIDKIRDTATSHQRVFVVEVMGRGAGDLALWAGVAAGAEAIVVPEKEYDIEAISKKLTDYREAGHDNAVIVIAEGVMSAADFKAELDKHGDFDSRATTIGHVQRGGSPTARDRVLASKMGNYAVELLLAGKGGLAIGIENNQVTEHPMEELFDEKHHADLDLYDMNNKFNQ